MEILGWASSIFFSVCAVPQAFDCWKRGEAGGISSFFLLSWFMGEVLGIAYTLHIGNLPILFSYLFNLAALLVILRYKYLPKQR